MAKRKPTFSLDTLVSELRDLDARRKTLISQLSRAIRSLAGGEALTMPASDQRRGRRPAGTAAIRRKGPRRRKMSAAARKAISEAQKKRWAAQKSRKKLSS
jgi:hypothetical protein